MNTAAAPQVAVEVALQGYHESIARQEQARVTAALQRIQALYAGGTSGLVDSDTPFSFVALLYNPLTPQMRQLQWGQGMFTGVAPPGAQSPYTRHPQPILPPRPPMVAEADWLRAVVNNPDPTEYMPVAVVGAPALLARLSGQQEQAQVLQKQGQGLGRSLTALQQRNHESRIRQATLQYQRQHARLLDLMAKVEVLRSLNRPLHKEEAQAQDRLVLLRRESERLQTLLHSLKSILEAQPPPQVKLCPDDVTGIIPTPAQLKHAVKEHRTTLATLTGTLETNVLDVHLMRERVSATAVPAIR
jgi:Nucleoporin complex subunit 54